MRRIHFGLLIFRQANIPSSINLKGWMGNRGKVFFIFWESGPYSKLPKLDYKETFSSTCFSLENLEKRSFPISKNTYYTRIIRSLNLIYWCYYNRKKINEERIDKVSYFWYLKITVLKQICMYNSTSFPCGARISVKLHKSWYSP